MIKIDKKANCCGCTACYCICKNDAISMETDDQGFIYPIVNLDKCIGCGACDKVCPILNSDKLKSSFHRIYAVRAKNKDILKHSSSGGAFFIIASYVIDSLCGVVFGVEYNESMEVVHNYAETIEDLKKFHGSKYVQSNLLGVFSNVKKKLKEGRKVLFSGTPCQVAGLRLFLRHDCTNLITVDLVCHSVASPTIFRQYTNLLQNKYKKKLLWINLRDKKYGWSHKFYSTYQFENSKIGQDALHLEDWNKIFFSGFITRPSCNKCKFTSYNRVGDFSISDFWDDSSRRPDIYSNEGSSCVFVNTDKSREIFEQIKQSFLYWQISDIDAFQPCLVSPVSSNLRREEFWEYYKAFGFEKAYTKYFKTSFKQKFKITIKKCLHEFGLYNSYIKIVKHVNSDI